MININFFKMSLLLDPVGQEKESEYTSSLTCPGLSAKALCYLLKCKWHKLPQNKNGTWKRENMLLDDCTDL